jgi:hypothetical protein
MYTEKDDRRVTRADTRDLDWKSTVYMIITDQ